MEAYRGSAVFPDANRPHPSQPTNEHQNRPTGGNRKPGFRVHPAVEVERHHSGLPCRLDVLRVLVPVPRPTFTSSSADTVTLYVADLAVGLKPATITRRISAISQAHQIAGMESPTRAAKVRLVLAGIRRTLGTAQEAKTPVLVDDLKRMIARLPEGLLGV